MLLLSLFNRWVHLLNITQLVGRQGQHSWIAQQGKWLQIQFNKTQIQCKELEARSMAICGKFPTSQRWTKMLTRFHDQASGGKLGKHLAAEQGTALLWTPRVCVWFSYLGLPGPLYSVSVRRDFRELSAGRLILEPWPQRSGLLLWVRSELAASALLSNWIRAPARMGCGSPFKSKMTL